MGDKGTNMRFDNSKVMNAIGYDYDFTVNLAKGLKASVDYYLANASMQVIDCKFEGECDFFVYKKTGERYSLVPKGFYDNKRNYFIMTNDITRFGVNLLRKLRKKK